MTRFSSHPCFTPSMLVQSKRGPACHALSDAMKGLPGTEPIRILIGSCCLPEKRAEALAKLHDLPIRVQDAIVRAEAKLFARKRREAENAAEVRS